MSILAFQKKEIKGYLIQKIRKKLHTYNPETSSMPFHYRLLGKERMALFSFIHSVNTMLGQSIFEKSAQIIAKQSFKESIDQYNKLEGYISSSAVLKIDSIMRNLRAGVITSNKEKETEEVLSISQEGELGKKQKKRVDLFLLDYDNVEYYFDLKTAKPNIDQFTAIKRKLLEWIAIRGNANKNVKIKTILAIPYNPYEPNPYERWTLQGLFDLVDEVLVASDFWDFLGGKGSYQDLLDIFEEVGLKLYNEIEDKMKNFK